MAGKLERKVIVKRFLIYDQKQFNELAGKIDFYYVHRKYTHAFEVSAMFYFKNVDFIHKID